MVASENAARRRNGIRMVLAVLAAAAVMAAFYVMNYYTFLCYDDYYFSFSRATGERFTSLSQVLPSLLAGSQTDIVKVTIGLIGGVFLVLGKPAFNIANTVAFTALLYVIYFHAFGTYRNFSIWRFLFLSMLLFICTPAFGQSYLWLCGAVNYVFGNLVILAFLMPYRAYLNAAEAKRRGSVVECAAAIAALIFGFFAGASLESMSVAMIAILILYLAAYRWRRLSWRVWHFTGLAGAVLGCFLLLAEPANWNRLDGSGGSGGPVLWGVRFVKLSCDLANYLHIPLILLLFLFGLYLHRRGAFQKIWWKRPLKNVAADFDACLPALIYLLGCLAAIYPVMFFYILPARTWSGPVMLILIAVGSLAAVLEQENRESPETGERRYVRHAAFFCALAVFIGCYIPALYELQKLHRSWQEQQEIIQEALAHGETRVELPIIWSVSPYSPVDLDLRGDSSNWINASMAKYYGLEEIVGIAAPRKAFKGFQDGQILES